LRVEKNDRYGQLSSPLALLHYGHAQALGGRTAVGANLVVRRAVHDALGGFASHLGRRRGTLLCGEDHEFSQRAVAAGYRCEYRPELRVRHWVPAERTRLSYHLRWFFWSGVTNAVLEGTADPVMAERAADPIPRYLWRQLFTAPLAAAKHALAGRMTDGVVQLMDGAFALGYIAQRVEDRWSRGSRLYSELPAASEPAPIGSSADPRKML
jgi:hypothetical protein